MSKVSEMKEEIRELVRREEERWEAQGRVEQSIVSRHFSTQSTTTAELVRMKKWKDQKAPQMLAERDPHSQVQPQQV